MGSGLQKFVSAGNDAPSGTKITDWLTREGVNLTVEVNDGSGFRRAAVLPPTGPARLRRIAVPVNVSAEARTLQVRLRGGVGFWRFDSVRLASVMEGDSEAKAMVTRVPAKTAVSSREGDSLSAIQGVDRVHNALETLDETLALTFTPPAPLPGMKRSAFLSTTGYYNVHPPLENQRRTGVLLRIRDRPGSLSQLGLDLVRDYLHAEESAPRATAKGGAR